MSEGSEIKRLKTAKAHKNSGRNMVKGDGTWGNFVIEDRKSVV
jgi:hypothetical protein